MIQLVIGLGYHSVFILLLDHFNVSHLCLNLCVCLVVKIWICDIKTSHTQKKAIIPKSSKQDLILIFFLKHFSFKFKKFLHLIFLNCTINTKRHFMKRRFKN